ncbi:hypothetical protein PYW07_000615 [Mythimna separata]|uniref:Lysozyme n=1 Tax=Mythimna separata TaxID=271217 RepID=A0AAD7Z3F4_MYTSE|nr:hypothetical protein PYW07_000615 [Mythimna separata]
MYRVALLCALLCAGAGARVLERCELARELSALGVRPDHLSTWVCIAYHESRFDTNANNPYSGDHGIFQISELYWCGAGKACGLPCAALHDDDISDDLDCALVVHEEHTRLQGNGFLAWVVYPQHCKHNTKKYLVDCDLNSKNSVLLTKSREYQYGNSYEQENDTVERQNVEKLLPPYLSIGNIVRENYGKVYDPNRGRTDWYNYKYDNIDDLRLPVFNQPSQYLSMPAPTSAPRRTTTTTTTTVAPRRTTTATTAYVPRVKVWRVIETNQFRKRKKFNEAEKATPKPEYSTDLGRYTQSTISSTSTQLPRTTVYPLSIATTPRVTTTTVRPTTRTTAATTPYTSLVHYNNTKTNNDHNNDSKTNHNNTKINHKHTCAKDSDNNLQASINNNSKTNYNNNNEKTNDYLDLEFPDLEETNGNNREGGDKKA